MPKRGGMFGNILGVSPSYDTRLSPEQEASFQAWRRRLPGNLQGTEDYDLRGAWQANAQEAANGHLPDTWKKPNHMTFSTGSMYSGRGGVGAGGGWFPAGGDAWTFWASPENLRQHSAPDLSRYFTNYEPDSAVVLPLNYQLPRR